MEDSEITITLIGTKLAKVGNQFIFRGAAKDCEACKLNKTCLNLNIGSKYRISGVRNTGKLECFVHDSGVVAVEVMEAPVKMSLESRKAIKGSKVMYEPLSCTIRSCENYALCHPSGIKKGEKFTVIEVGDEIIEPCEGDYILKIVEVTR